MKEPLIVTIDPNLLLPPDCWFEAPPERTARFLPVFSKVSRALQRALRDTLPEHLFHDIEMYGDLTFAFPMLVYGASHTSSVRSRADFHYDVQNVESMELFFASAERGLKKVLPKVHEKLMTAGRSDLAATFRPMRIEIIVRSVRTTRCYRKPLNQMLVTEALLLNELVALCDPANAKPVKRPRTAARFVSRWTSLLRRFCKGFDFVAAGPAILRASTAALLAAQAGSPDTEPREDDD